MTSLLKDLASTTVAVIEPEATAQTVAQVMRRDHVGALVVVDALNENKPLGIVTDRDLVIELMAEGLDPSIFTAGDIMSVNLVLASPEMDAMQAIELMRTHRVRRLVLVDATGQLAGIVTLEDLLQFLSTELGGLASALAGAQDRETAERP